MLSASFDWTANSERRNRLTARYEPVQPHMLLQLAESLGNATFLDIGANIGFYSVILANHPNITSVLAFEPNPYAAAEITKNLVLNNFSSKVNIHELALSDCEGIARLALTSKLGGDAAITDTRFHSSTAKHEVEVRVAKLDDLLQWSDTALLIKMDIEGHEYKALKGAKRILSKNTGFLQLEILNENSDKKNIIDFLQSIGWEKVIAIGPDFYFTNIARFKSESERLLIVEKFLAAVVEESLHGVRDSRRTLMRGVTLELSRSKVEAIKRLIKPHCLTSTHRR